MGSELEKYLIPCITDELEKLTATNLQKAYTNGFLNGQKKAFDECNAIAIELSQIKSGCSIWLEEHDAKVRANAIDDFLREILFHENCVYLANCNIGVEINKTYIDTDTIERVANRIKEGKNDKTE